MKNSRKIAMKVSIIYIILGVSWIIITDFISIDYSKDNFQLLLGFKVQRLAVYLFNGVYFIRYYPVLDAKIIGFTKGTASHV